MKRPSKKTIIISIALLIMAALLMALRKIPGFAVFYSANIYPIFQGSLGRLSGLVPFSLSELILYALPIILIIDIVLIIRSKTRGFKGLLKRMLLLVSVIAFLYSANCGVNYYNTSFLEAESLSAAEYETSDEQKNLLVEFCEFTASKLQESSMAVYYRDEYPVESVEEIYPRGRELADLSVSAMKRLGNLYPSLAGFYPRPKALVISRPFSNMGVTGIYSPFTIEANYNSEMPAYNFPYTACHELSHLKGYMDEGEANFIGWLACINSDQPAFNRSGYLIAWIYGGNELMKVDRKEYDRIYATLPENAIKELKDNSEFWNTHETKASEVQDIINDAYLQYNGLEEGILSYDRVLVMMLGWFQHRYH